MLGPDMPAERQRRWGRPLNHSWQPALESVMQLRRVVPLLLLTLGSCSVARGTRGLDEDSGAVAWSGWIPPVPAPWSEAAARFSVVVSAGKTAVELDGCSVAETWTSPQGDRTQEVQFDWHQWSGGAVNSYWLRADVELRQALSVSGEATSPVEIEIMIDLSFAPHRGHKLDWAWTGLREIRDRITLQGHGLVVTIVRLPSW